MLLRKKVFKQFPAAWMWLAGNTSVVNPGCSLLVTSMPSLEPGVRPVLVPGSPVGLVPLIRCCGNAGKSGRLDWEEKLALALY